MARVVMQQLKAFGEVRRGRFGMQAQDLTPELAETLSTTQRRGAVITQVERSSPAHEAGLREGDLVTTLNNKSIKSASDLRNRVGLLRIGSRVVLDVLRNGKALQFTGVIADPLAGEWN